MILVLAGAREGAAAGFAEELAPLPAAVLTCADLAVQQSCLRHPGFADSTIRVAGERMPVAAISGVVNALPAVLPEALTVYAEEERDYQAAELRAWLTFFLSSLGCPVVNRPTPLSLTGPVLSPIGWFHLARAAGIPLAPLELDSDEPGDPLADDDADEHVEVVAVGGALVEPSGTPADRHTALLAQRSGLSYLRARYVHDGATVMRFTGASSVPDLRCAPTRRALAALLAR